MIYCSEFFYKGEILDLYYDVNSKLIKFYLDGVEQDIPELNHKFNVFFDNNSRGKQLLLTGILSLSIIISVFGASACVVDSANNENDISTVSVENQLNSSDFYTILYNVSNDSKKEILNLTKEIIKDNGDYIDQEYIINNFSSLNIVYTDDDNLLGNATDNIIGRYDSLTNTMYLRKGLDVETINTTIFHELLHFYSKSGFASSNIDKNGYIGDALNEGMTQLLVNEYFNNQIFVYSNEVSITKALVEIVGSDFMRESYFSHDLDSLIVELSKYTSYENVISLLKNMDNAKVAYNDEDRGNYNIFNGNCWDIIENIYSNKYGIDMERDKLMVAYKDGTDYDSVVSVSKKYFVDNINDSYKLKYYYIDEEDCYLVDSNLLTEDDRYIDINIKKKTT